MIITCVLDAITYRLFRLFYKITHEEEENGFAIAAKCLAQHFYRARISTRLNAIRWNPLAFFFRLFPFSSLDNNVKFIRPQKNKTKWKNWKNLFFFFKFPAVIQIKLIWTIKMEISREKTKNWNKDIRVYFLMSKCTLSSLNILNNKFKIKRAIFEKKILEIYDIFSFQRQRILFYHSKYEGI